MLDQVKTVQDLIKLNEQNEEKVHEKNVADNIVDQILDIEPAQGLYIVNEILKCLEDFHVQGVKMYAEEGKVDCVSAWSADAQLLRSARELIKDIQLWSVFRNK